MLIGKYTTGGLKVKKKIPIFGRENGAWQRGGIWDNHP
jgi:hypothetical protein